MNHNDLRSILRILDDSPTQEQQIHILQRLIQGATMEGLRMARTMLDELRPIPAYHYNDDPERAMELAREQATEALDALIPMLYRGTLVPQWTPDIPTTPGYYWFYGYRTAGKHDRPKDTMLVHVFATSDNRCVYVADGHFFYTGACDGVWLPAAMPTPPQEEAA